MVFAGDLEERRESGGVGVDAVSYSVGDLDRHQLKEHMCFQRASRATHMLVDEDNTDVFPLLGEAVEGSLDG